MPRSEAINELVAALSKAQAEFSEVGKSGHNKHQNYYYSKLDDFTRATQPSLSKYGLAIIQGVVDGSVETTLFHSSGQFISYSIQMVMGKQDMQALGSAVTYARKYGLASILCIAPDDGTDDDGEAAKGDKYDRLQNKPKTTDTRSSSKATEQTRIAMDQDQNTGSKEQHLGDTHSDTAVRDQQTASSTVEPPKDETPITARMSQTILSRLNELGKNNPAFYDWVFKTHGTRNLMNLKTWQYLDIMGILK
jgi:hypothetical protein